MQAWSWIETAVVALKFRFVKGVPHVFVGFERSGFWLCLSGDFCEGVVSSY